MNSISEVEPGYNQLSNKDRRTPSKKTKTPNHRRTNSHSITSETKQEDIGVDNSISHSFVSSTNSDHSSSPTHSVGNQIEIEIDDI